MKKRLILLRHAKSDWDALYDGDHNRPLSPRGIQAAKFMGQFLANAQQLPDQVITSTALRAQSTVDFAIKAGRWPCPVDCSPQLYDATVSQALEVIHGISDEAHTVLLCGHEPTWSELTRQFIGGGVLKFPTAAMARIDFKVNHWRELHPGMGCLVWLLQPKLLTAGHASLQYPGKCP